MMHMSQRPLCLGPTPGEGNRFLSGSSASAPELLSTVDLASLSKVTHSIAYDCFPGKKAKCKPSPPGMSDLPVKYYLWAILHFTPKVLVIWLLEVTLQNKVM